MLTLTAIPARSLQPALQTVPATYEPVTIPQRSTDPLSPTIPLGSDEAPRVVLPTPMPTPTSTPEPPPSPRPTATARPAATSASTSSITGTATWYCNKDATRGPLSRCPVGRTGGLYAAISPELLWLRGRDVRACYGASCVVVTVVDCNCQTYHSIDLFADAFEVLAPLSRGRLRGVTISWH